MFWVSGGCLSSAHWLHLPLREERVRPGPHLQSLSDHQSHGNPIDLDILGGGRLNDQKVSDRHGSLPVLSSAVSIEQREKKHTMDDALEEALYCTIMAVVGIERKETEKRFWCKNWLQRRGHRGSFSQIFSELAVERPLDFENYIRMPVTVFYNLLTKVEPHIRKEDTDMRESISPGARLEATLRFLAAGAPTPTCSIPQEYPSRA